MNKILVFYPELFKSYEKIYRKLSKLTANMTCFSLTCPHDVNGFLETYAENERACDDLIVAPDWEKEPYTHAVIFDDGEEFPKEKECLKEEGIPLREVRILITRVINIKKNPEYQGLKCTENYEYIGRGSYWGNPYSMHENGENREEVIRKFEYDFEFDRFPNKRKADVYRLAGKRLGCFCKPARCHGDVLAEFLNSLDDGQ